MAKFAISQEGADGMQRLSENIFKTINGLKESTSKLKSDISINLDDLGTYGVEIWTLILRIDGIVEDKVDSFTYLAEKAAKQSENILEMIGLGLESVAPSGNVVSSCPGEQCSNNHSLEKIESWIKEINPNYHNPFIPPWNNPYHVNCGSCAYAVDSRLSGREEIIASKHNIGTDAAMEAATGKKCVYMSESDIERKLISMGPGSHLICGINRKPTPSGKPQSGHWFNAFYDGNKVYTIDGQSGEIFDWPHDYNDVAEWCALV